MWYHTLHQLGTIMSFIFQPWQLYFVVLAGWVNRQQQEAIEYLCAENRVLRETHGPKRILVNDDQRRRLAVKGKILGRQRLEQIGTLFTPDTILRRHRTLVAKKWDYSRHPVMNSPVIRSVWPLPEGNANEVGRNPNNARREKSRSHRHLQLVAVFRPHAIAVSAVIVMTPIP